MRAHRLLISIIGVVLPLMNFAAPVSTGYAPVNGLRLYYEIHGAADSTEPPLVLLHGGRLPSHDGRSACGHARFWATPWLRSCRRATNFRNLERAKHNVAAAVRDELPL